MSITNLTIPYSTPYQVSADDIDLIKIRSLETSPLTHEDLDDNFANLMNKVNALVDTIGGSSAAISVDEGGKVGIGTSSPEGRLHVKASSSGATDVADGTLIVEQGSNPSIQILSAENRIQSIKFGDPQAGDVGRITYSHLDDKMSFVSNGTSNMVIASDGNVGIGTTNPSAKFDIRTTGNTSDDGLIVKSQNGGQRSLRMWVDGANDKAHIGAADGTEDLILNANGGGIGIGTTSPSYELEVESSSPVIGVTSTTSSAPEFRLENTLKSWANYLDNAGELVWLNRSDSKEVMRIDSDGNVGIGTTSPSAVLDVTGSLDLLNSAILQNTSATGYGLVTKGGGNGKSRYIADFRDKDNSSALKIDGDGNVGIGTTSPDEAFHIKGDDKRMFIGSDDYNLFSLGRRSSTELDTAYLSMMDEGDQKVVLDTSGDSYFNGGNVGIGTTNPQHKLDISTNDTTGLRLINPDSAEVNQSNDPPAILFQANGWELRDDGDGSRAYSARIRVSSNYSGESGRGNTHPVMNFDLETNENNPDDNLSTKMMINADGKVGIGTTSPSAKLEINSGTNDANLRLVSTDPYVDIKMSDNTTTDYGVRISNKGDDLLLQRAGGRVGIGTTSPSATLDIQGTAKLNGADLATVDQLGGGGIWAENTSGAYYNGNVGIGTTSPDKPLEIAQSDGTSGIRLNYIPSAYPNNYLADIYHDGANGLILESKLGSATIAGDILLAPNGGNIGIGTTSPDHPLEIQASGSKYGCHILDDQGGSLGGLFISEQGAATDGLELYLKQPNGNTKIRLSSVDNNPTYFNSGRVGIGTTSPDSKLHLSTTGLDGLRLSVDSQSYYHMIRPNGDGLYIGADEDSSGGSGADIRLNIKGDEKMRIDSDGNVGIGTSSPSANLHVLKDMGSTNVDGSFTLQKTAYTRSSSHPEGSGQFMTHKLHELSYSGDFSTSGNNHLNDTIIGLDVNLDTNAGGQYAALFNGGNVGIGLTTPDCKLTVVTDNALSGYAMKIGAGGGGQEDRGLHIAAGRTVPNGAGQCVYIGFHDGDGTATGGIRCSANPSTPEFFSSSDIRMKKNIEDCDINGIEKIKSLKLRKWDWNTEKDMPPTDLGLIADELEEVYPELVSRQKMEGWEHCVSEGEEDLKTIPSESKITLTLVKAIQEQQTIIEDLKSRIVTLEGGSPEPDKAEEPVVEEVTEEPVAEEAPEPQAVEEPQPEPQEIAQVSLGQVSLGQVSVGQVSLSESPLDEIKEIRAEDGKEYIRIGDKDYEVLGENEDGSLILDDDVTNNG